MRVHAHHDADAVRAVDRREIEAYLAEADASSGLIKQTVLQRAITLSRDRGFTDLRRQATAKLQAIPVADLDLKPVSADVASSPVAVVKRPHLRT
jgi:hypothetical protein